MAIDVYINFNGNCREAVEYYAQIFGTEKPQFFTFGDAPPNPEFSFPEETKDLIMHTQLNILGSTIMFSDVPPGMPFVAGNNISLSIPSNDVDEIKSLYLKLKEGGTVGTSRNILEQMLWQYNRQVWYSMATKPSQ